MTQLSTALSNIPQPVVILRSVRDDAGAIVDFRWTFLNEAADAAIPTAEDLIGTRLLDLVPDHPRDLFDAYVQVVETGEPLSVDNVVFDTWVGEPVDTNPVLNVRATKVDDGLAVCWTDVTALATAAADAAAADVRAADTAAAQRRKAPAAAIPTQPARTRS